MTLDTSQKFVLDADVFIAAARRYYAFDLAPRFWQELIAKSESGKIVSIDKVKKELLKGNDELARWAENQFRGFVSTDDDAVVQEYRQLMNWARGHQQFTESAKTEFASSADGWLIAFALAHDYSVVTNEILAPPDKRSKIKIPNVCLQFKTPCVDTFEMLRRLKIQFS